MKQYRQLDNKSVPYGLTIYFFLLLIAALTKLCNFYFYLRSLLLFIVIVPYIEH